MKEKTVLKSRSATANLAKLFFYLKSGILAAAILLPLATAVKAQSPQLSFQNMAVVPHDEHVVFSRIGSLASPPAANAVHDVSTLRLHNVGDAPLQISALTFNGPFQLNASVSLPITIAAGASTDIHIRFVAQTGSLAGGTRGFHTGSLTVTSNDPIQEQRSVHLEGYWQNLSENNKEPNLREIVRRMFGYQTQIFGSGESLNNQGRIESVADEVISAYWKRADTSKPVTVRQLAAWHGCCTDGAFIDWYAEGSPGSATRVFAHQAAYGQSALPLRAGSSNFAVNTFNPGAASTFGFRVDNQEWSDPALNDTSVDDCSAGPDTCGHHMRFWPAKDANGTVIPGTFFMGMDYAGINYDFQDNVYLISNVLPADYPADAVAPAAPTSLTATDQTSGVLLDWADNAESDVLGYHVYRSATQGGPYTRVNELLVSGSTFNDTNAPFSKSSYYVITAVDETGRESGNSAEVRGIHLTPVDPFTDIAWGLADSQNFANLELQGAVVGGKFYSFGGYDIQKIQGPCNCYTPTNRAFVYDPAVNNWTPIANLPFPNGGGVTHAGTTTDGNDIFFAGGYISNATQTGQIFGTNQVWRYNVSSNTYTALPNLPATRAAGALLYQSGKLHFFGGTNLARTQETGDHYVLDYAAFKAGGSPGWTTAAPLPSPRNHLGSAALNGKLYAIGGANGHDEHQTTQALVHEYDPLSNSWTARASLPNPRSHIGATTIVHGGRILVLGGDLDHLQPVSSVYAFNPLDNTWATLTSLPANRSSGLAGSLDGFLYYTAGSLKTTTYKGTPGSLNSGCQPWSPFECNTLPVSLPFALTWNTAGTGLTDLGGEGLGLNAVAPPSNRSGTPFDPNVPGYEPADLDLITSEGILAFTSNGGTFHSNPSNLAGTNSLLNALAVPFDANLDAPFTITVHLKDLPSFSSGTDQQAGVWFGLGEDDYAKVIVRHDDGTGYEIQTAYEVGGVFTTERNTAQVVSAGGDVILRMHLDPVAGTVRGRYSLDGGSTFTPVGSEISVSSTLFEGITLPDGTTGPFSFAGITTAHFGATVPLTFSFDQFEVDAGPVDPDRPTVTATSPADGETAVERDIFVSVDVHLPNVGQGIDGSTLSSSTVKLFPSGNPSAQVTANLNTSGGGDAIVLQPVSLLAANTAYTFQVTDGLKDLAGKAFIPFTATFTTGATPNSSGGSGIVFQSVILPGTSGRHTSLVIGPDGRLYATTFDGFIKRWDINANGTLSNLLTISTIRNAEGGSRLAVGLAFDPASTPSNPIAWVTHSTFGFNGVPDWDGKISRLSGTNLGTIQDYVVNLPRSIRDHATNSLAFGPDGALYVNQGSNSSLGAPDAAWGNRPEHALNAAVLRVSITALESGPLPLDVKTAEGGTYDPFATDAPVRIFASGVRNAYDLVWHSNGNLYVPTNGGAANGNSPASVAGTLRPDGSLYSGQSVPAIDSVATQNDFLFRVPPPTGGTFQYRYYGHPNPSRGEYALNGGNPTSGADLAEVLRYPTGINPDPAWQGFAYNFGHNVSPNGVIEYKNNAFGGQLAGKLIVARYSGGDDLIALTPDGSGDIAPDGDFKILIDGVNVMSDPLELVENTANGHLYVSEYGGAGQIRLLIPGTNQLPDAQFTATPDSGDPLTIHFDGSGSSDSDGSIVQYAWDFGDGNSGSGVTTPHTFASSGLYTVTLTVTDNESGSGFKSSPISAGGNNGQAFAESGGLVVIEAENHHNTVDRSGHAWTPSTQTGAVGGSMVTTPNNGANIDSGFTTTSPEMQYEVDFSTTGTYYVWARVWATGNDNDSIHAGLNGQASATSDKITTTTSNSWVWTNVTMDSWSRATLAVPSAGLNTISIWMREDGMVVDRFLLTQDPSFTPIGNGPAESPTQNLAPTASFAFTPDGSDPLTIDFDGSASTDDDGTIISHEWDFGDGNTGSGITVSHTYAADDTYTVTLTVTDDGGQDDVQSEVIVVGDPATGAFTEAGGVVVMEAENAHTNLPRSSHEWTEISQIGAVDSALSADPNSGANISNGFATSSPELQFEVDFSASGTYYVWARIWASSNDDDSFHAGLNGAAVTSADNITTSVKNAWSWANLTMDNNSRATMAIPSAGEHTISIWMREDGTILDRILLTNDSGFTPTGAGPAESPRADGSPVADFTFSANGSNPLMIEFDGSASVDNDGSIVTYQWDFGDGNSGSGQTTSHTYASGNTYVVTLAVTDNDDKTGQRDQTVFVSSGGSVVVGEAGRVTFTQNNAAEWQTITLSQSYVDPIVVAGPVSYDGAQPATTRVRNVTSSSFQLQVDEWEYLDGVHFQETVGYLVMERGHYTLDDGTNVEAGTVAASSSFQTIAFGQPFSTPPAVVSQVVTTNESAAVITRQNNVSASGFSLKLQGEEASLSHGAETASYIAIEPVAGTNGGGPFEAGRTGSTATNNFSTVGLSAGFTQVPVLVASMLTYNGPDTATLRFQGASTTAFSILVQEEQSFDAELTHTGEAVGYLAFTVGSIYGDTLGKGSVPAHLDEEPELPDELVLRQNYPNPFNPETTIAYELPQEVHVRLEVFDVMGRRVRLLVDGVEPAGQHNVRFVADGLTSGTYFYRLQAGSTTRSQKMILIK